MPRPPLWKTPASPLPAILAALEQGADLAAAARAGAVAPETLLRWMDAPEVAAQIEAAQGRWKAKGAAPGIEPGQPERPSVRSPPPASDGTRAQSAPRDRWAQVHEDAARLGPGLYGYLLWLEDRIAAHNEKAPAWDRLPPMPEPLLELFRDFDASGKQELDILGGRGLGKTTMFCRFTFVECAFAPPVVHGGEIAIWAELAQDMDAAGLALGVLEKLLEIAGLRKDPTRRESDPDTFRTLRQERGRSRIQFTNAHRENIEIRVYPATVAALSGPTLKGARHDEEQKWRANAKDGTSSAEDVLDAEAGAFRGKPHAHLYRMSSAYSTATPHHRDTHGIVVGESGGTTTLPDPDTADRMVARLGRFLGLARAGFEARAAVSTPADAAEIRAFAASLTERSPELPSWFNPAADPRTLRARSVRVFLREYGSRTTATGEEGDAFDSLLLDAAEKRARPDGEPASVHAAIDTGAKRNPAALAIVGRWETDDGPRFAPLLLRSWAPAPGAPLDLRRVVLPAMARATVAAGAGLWSSDGFASDQIELVAAEFGIRVEFVATSEAWRDVYAPVADGLARGEVALSGCAGIADAVGQLRRVSTERTLGADGAHIRVVVPEDAAGEHGDLGVALVRALAAAGCGKVVHASWGVSAIPGRYAGADPRAAGRSYGGRMRA